MSSADLAAKAASVDAVVCVHMFGNLCDMRSLQEAANGKPMIEDCAQSLGSRIQGRMAGSFGSVAFFSFRSGKYLSVGEGGALFSNDESICSRMERWIAAMRAPGRGDECLHAVKSYIRALLRSKILYGLAGRRLWSLYDKSVDFSKQSPIVLSKIYPSDLAMAKKRLKELDFEIEKQRSNADFYSRNLILDPSMLCAEAPGTFYNRYLYPLYFPTSESRQLISEFMQSRGVGSLMPYQNIPEAAARHYGYGGDCPAAEEVSRRVLVIPSHHHLELAEVERIAGYVNEGWEKVRGRPRALSQAA
jgi:dTDP-4-amino-4,6-dideoxygalactose transaminase